MEILPEATFKIGSMVEAQHLVRAAFSILVSEEALRVGEKKYFKELEFKYKDREFGKGLTRFGRVREDLDEDFLNIIQHAGRTFSARIETTLKGLLDIAWVESLPEFAKLRAFQDQLTTFDETGNHVKARKSKVDSLIRLIRHFVRGRLVYCLVENMNYYQSKDATNHRIAERWKFLDSSMGPQYVHDVIYDSLSDFERILTRNFWEIVRGAEFTTGEFTNRIHDHTGISVDDRALYNRNVSLAHKYGVDHVTMPELENGTKEVNLAMRDTTLGRGAGLESRLGPVASGSGQSTTTQLAVDEVTEKLSQLDSAARIENPTLDDWYVAEERVLSGSHLSSRDGQVNYSGHEAIARDTSIGVPRFSLSEFLKQVKLHTSLVCNRVLNKGENDWSVLCPTLLCLTDEEYKYLPMWAGGLDDGTGGVFEEDIPFAEKGPVGPGPSFHTGSTVNSLASDADFDTRSSAFDTATMEGVETSLGVEDGFTDHLDRRVVYSEADFPMTNDASSVDSHSHPDVTTCVKTAVAAGQGAGNGPVGGVIQRSGGAPLVTSDVSAIDSDDFFNTGGDDDEEDFDMDDSGSEGTITEE